MNTPEEIIEKALNEPEKTEGEGPSDLSDDLKGALKSLRDELYNEVRAYRDYKIPMWRRNEAFWNNIQRAMYLDQVKSHVQLSELAKIPELGIQDAEQYNRLINIYRAHGESFVAALSANLPSAVYTPDDADDYKDIVTSKAYRKLTNIIQIRTRAISKFIKILYHLYNHGVAYSYCYSHRDKKYGVNKTPKIDYKEITRREEICPNCGSPATPIGDQEQMDPMGSMMGENFEPSLSGASQEGQTIGTGIPEEGFAGSELPGQNQNPTLPVGSNDGNGSMESSGSFSCQNCGYQGETEVEEYKEEIPFISSYDESPKARICVDVYGPLNVIAPQSSRNLEDSGYIGLEMDADRALIKSIYPDILFGSASPNQVDYDKGKSDRTPANQPYVAENADCVVSRWWFRPWMFYRLSDDKLRDELLARFDKGCYAVFVDDKLAETVNESFDECWTVTESPISERMHAEPYGNILIPLQEMTNDLVALVMETIESEIPINLFDPKHINPETLRDNVPQPGDWIPATRPSGMSLDASIASSKPAQMSRGIDFVLDYFEKQAQFTLGTVPSIFGGQAGSGSKTLGEYKESRANALQRLSIPWVCASNMWVDTMFKAANQTASIILQDGSDERYAMNLGQSNFINVWVKQSELEGKVGYVSVEASEQIPMTYNQKRTMILEMIAQGNEMLNSVLFHPENVANMEQILGLTDFYIPGSEDREKQLHEIYDLMQGEPTPGPPNPETGQPQFAPSVEIDPEVDNHAIHVEIIKAFLVSEVGQELKKSNPGAYENIKAHLNAHNQMIQMQQMQQPPVEGEENNQNKENPNG